ncbi:MAG: hypothetical protein IPK10_01855 [Bacteroidetes bacterium]|nr:hypothetical protein [Bacteroidota bacterium]
MGLNTDATKWEWGFPNYGLTNSTHSGVKAWDINLNSVYGHNANSVLYSPYFNCASLNIIDLSFWYNSELEWLADGVRLEESTNDGISWNVVDTNLSFHSSNWYNLTLLNSSSLPAWSGNSGSWIKASLIGRNVSGVNRVFISLYF